MAKKLYLGEGNNSNKVSKLYIGEQNTCFILEYIESTGTQYIDTEFKPNQNTRVVFDYFPVATKNTTMFGSRTSTSSNDRFLVLHANDTDKLRTDYGNNNVTTGAKPTERTIIDKNKAVTTIGSQSWTNTASTFTGKYNMLLFALNNNGSATSKSSLKLYSCKIYDNGTLIRDYKPARDYNNNIGLYDIVNNKFYKNKGTGSFKEGKLTGEQIDGGISSKIKKGYIGIGNKSKLFYAAEVNYLWDRYTIGYTQKETEFPKPGSYTMATRSPSRSRWKVYYRLNSPSIIDGYYNFPNSQDFLTAWYDDDRGWRDDEYSGSYYRVYYSMNQRSKVIGYGENYPRISGDDTSFSIWNQFYPVYKYELVDSKGTYVDTIKSTNPNAYPKNGISGNYWYVYKGQQ